MKVVHYDNRRRSSQEEKETSSSVKSPMTYDLLAAAVKKAKGGRLRAVKETIASLIMENYRDMDKALERAIAECGLGLDRAVSEARAKFEAESAEDRKRVVEEAVSALRERHDSELREAIDT